MEERMKTMEAEREKMMKEEEEKMTRMEEELRRQGTLKPGEHLTKSDVLRIISRENMLAPRTQAQEPTFGYWTPEGNLVPQNQVPAYFRRLAGVEPRPADAAQASPATTPGTLFNQQPVMGTVVPANALPVTEMSGDAVVLGVPLNK